MYIYIYIYIGYVYVYDHWYVLLGAVSAHPIPGPRHRVPDARQDVNLTV